MQQLTQVGSFTNASEAIVNQLLASTIGVTSGNIFYLDPVNGLDTNTGLSPSAAVKTLSAGYGLLTSGNNDVLVIVGNGAASGSVRLSAAFTWAKSAAHLVGMCSNVSLGRRARIAPTSGATAFANFFTVTGSGCVFSNVQFFHGFAIGTTSQIAVTVTGGRNLFQDCDIQGMGDNESAQNSGSRSLLIKTTGENTFRRCTIGLDTILRTTTNSSVEILGTGPACPRNSFERCLFPVWSSSASATILLVTAGAGVGFDRWVRFTECEFLGTVIGGGTSITGVAKLGASQNGSVFFRQCTCMNVTGFGLDATSRNQILIDGGAPAGDTTISQTGIGVAPTK